MKKDLQPSPPQTDVTGGKKVYRAPKLVSYGDFSRLTRSVKGVVDKDSSSAPLRTRQSGGANP